MKYTYWFKANKNGMGWRPANWKGLLMIVIYIVTVVYSFFVASGASSFGDRLMNFFPKFLVVTALLIIVTYLKGESIVWGEKEKDHKIP